MCEGLQWSFFVWVCSLLLPLKLPHITENTPFSNTLFVTSQVQERANYQLGFLPFKLPSAGPVVALDVGWAYGGFLACGYYTTVHNILDKLVSTCTLTSVCNGPRSYICS